MIAFRPDLYAALADVRNRAVDFFDGIHGGHPAGYGWHSGGVVPVEEQLALDELAAVHLIGYRPVPAESLFTVALSVEGEAVLSTWDLLGGSRG